jgi:hypothetical protein
MIEQKIQILRGLSGWHNIHLSPSELPHALDLEKLGFIHIWYVMGGFPAARITESGQTKLKVLNVQSL